jgi:hypothetical protein
MMRSSEVTEVTGVQNRSRRVEDGGKFSSSFFLLIAFT